MLYRDFASLFLVAGVLCVTAEDAQQIHLDAAGHPAYGSMADVTPPDSETAPFCLSAADAAVIGRDFGLLISNYTTKLAVQLLAEEFIDQADSVNTLINTSPLPHQPVGSDCFY